MRHSTRRRVSGYRSADERAFWAKPELP